MEATQMSARRIPADEFIGLSLYAKDVDETDDVLDEDENDEDELDEEDEDGPVDEADEFVIDDEEEDEDDEADDEDLDTDEALDEDDELEEERDAMRIRRQQNRRRATIRRIPAGIRSAHPPR
jgi:hypothetical protein